jgi:predicted nucleotidyltransferase
MGLGELVKVIREGRQKSVKRAAYNNVINNQLDIFCRENSIELLVLFGSSAKGESNETSDADLAVKAVAGARADRLKLILGLELLFMKPVDLVFLNSNTDPLLLNEIFSTGRPLYQLEADLFYRWKAHCYLDTAGLRVRQWEHVKQRMAGKV